MPTENPNESRGAPDRPGDMPRAGWLAILKRSLQQFSHDDVTDRAAALTFFGVQALFPAVLALISVLGFLGKSTTDKVLNNLEQLAPSSVKSFLTTVIHQVEGKAGAAGIAAIVGLLLALWSASGYVAAFTRAANSIYEVDEGRPIWKTAPVRLLVTLALVVMLVIALLIIVVTGPIATQAGKAFGIGDTAVLIWDIAKWPVLLIVVVLMLALLYQATPNVKQPKIRWITAGSVIAVVIWLVASALFALYVSFSGSYNKTYGSLATVIVFLVWLWITNIAILLGVEFNAETQRERAIRAGMPADLEPFAELRDTRKLQDTEKRQAEHAAEVRRRTMSDTESS
ncbi:YihY/virulence factor BrkB family protein [Jatrophihabitans endophyticus]|uniref:YihY/virulence factor BrkB family protein n=1 Tax=Jatrophihabitans endophyticus TaxID=1206085 RepID=UPI0019FB136E|nr:YihY/virulence factor BrkB family protein [Jatrophihabitans endophyticus]MBE7189460.1 YihY/virulence factor BrkB family protein [Jatrophihabitans endophyticus]